MVLRPPRWVRVLLGLALWAGLALLIASVLFTLSTRSTELASHHAVVQPTWGSTALVDAGPLLPQVRLDAGQPVGVRIELGATDAASPEELVERYAFLASNPDAQVNKVADLVRSMALEAAVRGAVLALVPFGLWWLVGAERRRALRRNLRTGRGLAVLLVVSLAIGLLWQPWQRPATVEEAGRWQPLTEFLGPEVPVPDGLEGVEVRVTTTTASSRRLVESAVDTYGKSKEFYQRAVEDAADLPLREPMADETVAVLVSDRHDNIGMDAVARAVGDAAGATGVLTAGDDTSVGKSWEAFSLDSLDRAFSDHDRWAVAGNHDNGSFVSDYLRHLGWVNPAGRVVEGPGGSTLLGVDDPRSSGLGSWRDAGRVSFADVAEELADTACAAEERVGTLLVHDAKLGRVALERGCVDLVVGGHLHVEVGPDPVVGEDGQLGWTYTNGTTGGAAYAIAIGSKPRRDAQLALITYRDGRPVGIQSVRLRTDGRFEVNGFVPLDASSVPHDGTSEATPDPVQPESTEPESTEPTGP